MRIQNVIIIATLVTPSLFACPDFAGKYTGLTPTGGDPTTTEITPIGCEKVVFQ